MKSLRFVSMQLTTKIVMIQRCPLPLILYTFGLVGDMQIINGSANEIRSYKKSCIPPFFIY